MICECGWKHDESECPMCGEKSPEPEKEYQQWNSTLKAKKRPNQVSKKRKDRGRYQAEAMENVARQSEKECQHCGMKISYWKYSNIHHIKAKGKYPELISDENNMVPLCDDMDVRAFLDSNEKRLSPKEVILLRKGGCHHVIENQPEKIWTEKKDLFR